MEPINTLMVEGTFDDQLLETAEYLDTKGGSAEASGLSAEVTKLMEKEDGAGKEEALSKIVAASSVLSGAPEKEYIPSYNLLLHLVRSSEKLGDHIPVLLKNLSSPPTMSPHNGPHLVLSVLSTLFNILVPTSPHRYTVFRAILSIVATHSLYESLQPQLKNVPKWTQEWECTPPQVRALYVSIADICASSSDNAGVYTYLLNALQTLGSDKTPESRELAVRIVKTAINLPSQLEFDDLVSSPAVIALSETDPELYQLFEVMTGGQLDDYVDFCDEHEGWVEENGVTDEVVYRKLRLLTLTSLAATCPDRSLPYQVISRALQVPAEEVEHWVIDVIRAGLVEGKLSQANQTFLIHRATYRQFGPEEWQVVGDRLETWKQSLRGILDVVRQAKEQSRSHRERDDQQVKSAMDMVEGRGRNTVQVEG